MTDIHLEYQCQIRGGGGVVIIWLIFFSAFTMSEPSKRHKYVGTNTNGEAQTYKRGREGGKYKGVGTDM